MHTMNEGDTTMLLANLVAAAMDAQCKIYLTAEPGTTIQIQRGSIGIEVYYEGNRFLCALRTDVRCDLATKITTVQQCAKVLGLQP